MFDLISLFLQLPVLRNLQRVIDELAFGVNTAQAVAGPSSRLIVEQVGGGPSSWETRVNRQCALFRKTGCLVEKRKEGRKWPALKLISNE